jgi:hypothetical protein
MTDIVLRDIDPLLFERIRRIGDARGWDTAATLLHILTHGLEGFEGGSAPVFADVEAHVLEAAIAAFEHVPDDPGFALIGRAKPALPEEPAGPDQSIDPDFRLQSPAYPG